VMQLFGSSDEKGSLLNRTANRAKMLTERDACVTATRRDVLVESRLLPEGRAELHACGLVALRVADVYRKLGYRAAGLAGRKQQNAIVDRRIHRQSSDQPPVREEAANAMATGNCAPVARTAHPDTEWQVARDISTPLAGNDIGLSRRFVVVSQLPGIQFLDQIASDFLE